MKITRPTADNICLDQFEPWESQ